MVFHKHFGRFFNKEEKNRLLENEGKTVDADGTLRITVTANRKEGTNKNPFLQNLENIDRNTFDDNITAGLNLGPYSQVESGIKYFEDQGLVGGKEEGTGQKTSKNTGFKSKNLIDVVFVRLKL